MKAIKNISMIMGAAMMLASCESIKEETCPSENIVEITASIADGQTKTAVQDGGTAVYWQPGDEVKVFFDGTGSKFTSLCSDLSRTSKFTGTLNVMFGFDEGFSDDTPLWGLYPYREDATADNVSVTTTLPSDQIACEGTFAQATNISIARSKGLSMAFYNVCGGVRFKLSTEGVTSVTMKSNGGEALAGKVKIGFDDENHPEILEITEPMSEVTLTCEEGFKTDAWYYIVTLPDTLATGVTFIMQTDSLKAKKVIDRTLTVKRSVFGSVASLDEEVVWKELGMPDENQIFYTSSDEQTIVPYNDAIYDAGGNKLTLVSNEYSNGKGVMTFSGDIDRIGTQAFYNRTKLVTLSLPEGTKKIDASAITNNIRLESLYLPESLTSIGGHCFENNTRLSSISTLGAITTLAGYFVQGCSSLASIVIPESVRTIGSNAFYGCNGLTSIVIPESVRAISSYAFYGCSNLASVVMPTSMANLGIGERAFYNCISLTSISIPEGVTSINDQAFWGCSNLGAITLPQSLSSIGDYAFNKCSSLISVDIPQGTTIIGKNAFSDCRTLASIVLNEGLISIAENAFHACTSLTSIVIPEGVTSIGNSAFSACISLTSIAIPEGVTMIGGAAFAGCSSLTSIVIPEGVITINGQTFQGCTGLTSVVIPEGVSSIGNSAFSGCSSLTSIAIPEGVTSIESYVFDGCINLASIIVPEGVSSIKECAFRDCRSLFSITIPEGVTSIGASAFFGCSSLTSINIPEGVSYIDDQTFYQCTNLISINIPDGVTTIDVSAFRDCSSLTSIILPSSLVSVANYAFYGCSNLAEVNCKPVVPPTIGSTTFTGTSALSRIYVPIGSVDAYKSAQNWSNYSSIIQPDGPHLTSAIIAFERTSVNVVVGETFQNLVSINSGAPITYSSSNADVATVDPTTGIVTGVSKGTTVITATANAVSNYTSATARYIVNVYSSVADFPVTITLSGTMDSDFTFTQGPITVSQKAGIGSVPSSSYNTMSTLRVYTNNTLEFSSTKIIIKIEMKTMGAYIGGSSTLADCGTYTRGASSSVWEGSSKKVIITNLRGSSDTSNIQLRPTEIKVTYAN